MIDFSILIPHKDCSHLLPRLLETIPQTDRFQTIVIDDHSTPEEFEIVKELQKKYNFELIQSVQRFCGNARNEAFPFVKGKWMICADADDFFTPKFEELVSKYKDKDADLIYFNVESRYSDTLEPAYRADHVHKVIKKYQNDGDEVYLRCRWITPWAKMYRWSFICKNGFEFGHLRAGEDNLISVQTGVCAKKIYIECEPMYCVTVSSGSITTTLNKDVFYTRYLSVIEANEYLCQKGYRKYQSSILYYLAKAYQFGWKFQIQVIRDCITKRANPFIGMGKLLDLKNTLRNKQNKEFIKDER